MRQAAAIMLGTLLLVTGGFAAAATPASAAYYADQACHDQKTNQGCNNATVTHDSNDPCWADSYPAGDAGGGTVYPQWNGWKFALEIRYSPSCRANFAYVYEISGPDGVSASITFAAKVRRGSGPDGGYLMYHSPNVTFGWTLWVLTSGPGEVLSPLVYAPTNPAEACISIPAAGGSNWDQYECTGYV